jgi:uncharacterized protein (TIGR02246 family)
MRLMVTAIVGAALSIGSIETAAQSTLREQAVQQTLVEMYRAIGARDVARYREMCTPDAVLIEREQLLDLNRDIATFTSRAATLRNRTDRLNFLSTRITGDAASVVFQLTTELESNGKVERRQSTESAVLVRRDGRWKVSLRHSTPLGVVSRDPLPE